MSYELDHVFICTSVDSLEASALTTFGLTEGPANTHPGQGTANRRFFFDNAMLELLWVDNETKAKSELTKPTRLWERWAGRDRSACPFGICFRPATNSPAPPFPAWKYRPKYLPDPLCIDIATNADILVEPMLFFLAFGKARRKGAVVKTERAMHPIGFREITRIEIVTPHGGVLSTEFKAVVQAGLVKVRSGDAYSMEIGFDEEPAGQRRDFRPVLPLVFHW